MLIGRWINFAFKKINHKWLISAQNEIHVINTYLSCFHWVRSCRFFHLIFERELLFSLFSSKLRKTSSPYFRTKYSNYLISPSVSLFLWSNLRRKNIYSLYPIQATVALEKRSKLNVIYIYIIYIQWNKKTIFSNNYSEFLNVNFSLLNWRESPPHKYSFYTKPSLRWSAKSLLNFLINN